MRERGEIDREREKERKKERERGDKNNTKGIQILGIDKSGQIKGDRKRINRDRIKDG